MKISARYEVLGLLGQGGMGVVYHVRDTTRGRENALKTLAPGRSEDIVERFLTEAQVMFRLEHDNIVRVYDFGKDGETYFLTMELIRGKNLRQLLNARQNKGFPLGEVVRMGIETADALNYAHSQKPEAVVHRDIKPVNIMIEEATGRVVVTDFGIAKLMADAGETQTSDLSRTVFAGTVPYSAPEQFQPIGATRRLDHRVDIYALGMVLFEIYTGRHFFAGLSADEVELHHRSLEGGACPVRTVHACDHKVILPDTPDEFVRALDKAIARDRNQRYRTAAEMLADLQTCAAAESVQACETARAAAESAGALDAAATDFQRGGALEEEAKALRQQGDHAKAGELFRSAAEAFGSAAAQAGARRAQRAAQQAKTAMQIVAGEAGERDVASLAPDAMQGAAALAAAAEASEAQGQYEQAAAQYRQAEEAYRAALVAARQAGARRAIEDEMPALRAAREAAEQADAGTLAADAFAAAVRDQLRLEEALASGELTRVRELLPRVREGFASAEQEAARRLQQSVEEARAAMRAVASEAAAAGAQSLAKAAFIEAESLAGAAEKLAERGQLELAVAQLGRATDAYRAAITTALRAGERDVLEKELPALKAARAAAEEAGAPALAADVFDAAAREQARLEEALSAGELTRVRDLLPKVGESFAAATSRAVLAKASQATTAARALMTSARDAALESGAERLVPDTLKRARAVETRADGAAAGEQWENAERLYREAAKAYEDVRGAALRRAAEERLAAALAESRSGMEAARTRARHAGAPDTAKALYDDAAALAKKAGGASNDAAGMTAAAADYARATELFDAAAADAERARRRNELADTLAAVEEARRQAIEAGAGRNPEFAAAADELAAAQRALAADELSLVVSSAATARERFTAAKSAVERAQAEAAADAALATMTAAVAEAREAGAEALAPALWAKAGAQQKQALARRQDGDCGAAQALAVEAQHGFEAALQESAGAAAKQAEEARAAAELAGVSDQASAAAGKSLATAEQRRQDGKLVAAVGAYRKAAEGFRSAREARATAARAAEAAAKQARDHAEKAEAARLAASEHRAALAHLKTAETALAAGRFGAAESAFAEAARGLAAAATAATKERRRAAALAARKEAEGTRQGAAEAGAAELAAAHLKRGDDALAAADRALASEGFDAAAADFRKASEAFEKARAGAARAALEREAKAARAEAERLRGTRAAGATGFFARRKLAKADAALAHGTAALATEDFAAATRAYEEAAELFGALPAAPAAAPAPPPPPRAAPAQALARGATPSESTTVLEGATRVERAAAFDAATKVERGPTFDTATMVEGPTVLQSAPALPAPARGLPVAWLGAAAAGVLLLAGVWMMRDRVGGSTPAIPDAARIATKNEVAPKPKTEVVPPVEQKPVEAKPVVPEPPPAATAVPQEVAKIEPPAPPPAPPLPRITSVTPEDSLVEPAGNSQSFQIALADPGGASYAWTVDGKRVGESSAALTVKPENRAQQIAVVARTAGGEVTHEWKLAALPPAKAPSAPPVISGFEPKDKSLQLAAGKSRRFSVKAKYDGPDPLRYAWLVDGKPAGGNTASFDFAPADDDEGDTHQVRAEVTAGGGQVARSEWTVTVPLAPVSITRQNPTPSEIVADLGDSTEFSVEARAGRAANDALSYTWTVNKRPAAEGSGPRFSYRPERAGSADVEVRIESPDRPAAQRRWTVKTREPAAEPAAEPTRVAALPPRTVATPAPRGGDARREIESWIAAYRAAYEQKNVERLVTLGVIGAEKRSALQNALNDLDELTVGIASSSIDVQGPDAAVVTLTREDSFKAGGRRQSKSINVTKTLRRVNGTWVAQ